jgi:tetratricopeptide (TPR) repeat protein
MTNQRYIKILLSCVAIFIFSIQALAQESVWASMFGGGMKAYEQGDYKEAERFFRLAITEAGRFDIQENPKAIGFMSDSLSGLGAALRGQKRLSDAEAIFRKQLQLLEMSVGESHEDYSKTLNNIGLLLAEQKKFKEAEEVHRRAMSLREKYDEIPRRNLAISLSNLAKVYFDQGYFPEAESLYERANEISSTIPIADLTAEDVEYRLQNENNLASIYVNQKKYKLAELKYKHIIFLAEKFLGKTTPILIGYLENYAELLRTIKRPVEAKKVENRVALLKRNAQ